jgi:hypothetical protein
MRLRAWLIGLAVAASACGPKVDLTKGLQVVDVTTGWADKGVVEGQNKIVPSITFAVKNVSDQTLNALDLNIAFHQGTETADWDTEPVMNLAGSEGLAPGATSKPVTVDSAKGYTAAPPQTRAEMLQNSHFIDARVNVFAKYSNTQWAPVGEFTVTRQLITR